jgi:hypothetical protein
MSLDGLKARLEQLLASGGDTRAYTDGLYQALLDTKVAIAGLHDALRVTRRELDAERGKLADAERRGVLATEIGDSETADLAGIWAKKHGERVALLERKLPVQEDELRMAERQLEEFTEQYKHAKRGVPPGVVSAGSGVPEDDEAQHFQLDERAREAQVRDQLAELKRKLGRQD